MEKRVPTLTTEHVYKPIDKDHLAEVLGGFLCGEENWCPFRQQGNCYTDREHLISANVAQGAEPLTEVEQMLKQHPDFIVGAICRAKHLQINVTWTRSEPVSNEFGVGYLLASPLNLNKKQRQRLKEIRKGV